MDLHDDGPGLMDIARQLVASSSSSDLHRAMRAREAVDLRRASNQGSLQHPLLERARGGAPLRWCSMERRNNVMMIDRSIYKYL